MKKNVLQLGIHEFMEAIDETFISCPRYQDRF